MTNIKRLDCCFSFCSSFPSLSANEENILQYLAFLQIQRGTVEMRPWRSKQGSAHCFWGNKGWLMLCRSGPSDGRLDLLGGGNWAKDIQQFNHRKIQPEKRKGGFVS